MNKDSLKQYIKILSVVRNVCAHDERLYDIRLKKGYELPNMSYHLSLGIPMTTGKYDYGKSDLFTVVLIFKKLLPKREFRVFYNNLSRNLNKLGQNISVISSLDVLTVMGFPNNWTDIVTL